MTEIDLKCGSGGLFFYFFFIFYFFNFFFNDTATTEIYTLSLHDALPIYPQSSFQGFASFASSAPSKNRYFFTEKFWSSILFEIVSQTHIGVVIDVVKFHILQDDYC